MLLGSRQNIVATLGSLAIASVGGPTVAQGFHEPVYICVIDKEPMFNGVHYRDVTSGYDEGASLPEEFRRVPCTEEFLQAMCSDFPEFCTDEGGRVEGFRRAMASEGGSPAAGMPSSAVADLENPQVILGEKASSGIGGGDGHASEAMDVADAQAALKGLGYDPGPTDGIMGGRTTAAIQAFQQDYGLPMTGDLDASTVAALRGSGGGKSNATESRPPQAPAAQGEIQTSDMSGSCQADIANLEADMARITAQAQGGGIAICEAHRANYEVLSKAAEILRRCPTADPTGAQAAEFNRAANESLAALNGPCS